MLEDPAERQKYFKLKAGPEIEKIKTFLENNTFVGFLMGPKNSGKGTYTKLFMEAVGADKVAHLSVGDIVRGVHKDLADPLKKKDLIDFINRRYRGFIELDKIWDIIEGRDTKTLLPTEIILALVEREIDRIGRKAIFIDGFPRSMDQISYSLYFRALIGYRNDPDFFVFIEIPEAVINERMKTRVVCPQCQTPRTLRLLRTKKIGYDKEKNEFFLICDSCNQRMVGKEGDELGIEAIRDRIEVDKKLMRMLLDLQGVPKVYLRNAIPVVHVDQYVDRYELTPSYKYELVGDDIKVTEEPWTVHDDEGNQAHSLMAPAVVVGLLKQTAQALQL